MILSAKALGEYSPIQVRVSLFLSSSLHTTLSVCLSCLSVCLCINGWLLLLVVDAVIYYCGLSSLLQQVCSDVLTDSVHAADISAHFGSGWLHKGKEGLVHKVHLYNSHILAGISSLSMVRWLSLFACA